ncbi:uncharacterized protein KY384_005788 [Bacidia gigantensis]|uniref:uncharacterized protein n=1 Tax=Bacidia gigantensis TaxID=2732470 RepID=UPI001D03D8D1|nr:uncharacterized protein KY384_005788 [Bacidia gigantensis]KAG8529153.1 hypothetical protein KY384_005788 [Bacidia gigantensis]
MQSAFDKGRQWMQQDAPENETRKAGDFRKTENSMPRRDTSDWKISLTDNVSSYLGSRNPMARDIDPKTESVWLFDNVAYRPVHVYPHKPQPHQAEFIAAYFQRNTGKDISQAVADIAEKIGLKKQGANEAETEKRIAERLQPFTDAIAPARSVSITLPNGQQERLGPGGRSAVSEQTLVALESHKDGETISIQPNPPEVAIHGAMTTHFTEPEGWLIISDIDDSVKTTMTPSPIGILQTTFVDDPKPIPGMPELYQRIQSTFPQPPTWFYLSASPYNLYPFLRSFLHAHYPPGPIVLRDASWMNLGGFLASLTQGTEAYKKSRIEKIHQWLPKRKVICVGDSTQSDPEAYGDICRKYPGWVRKVFIRRVEDVAEMQGTDKNSAGRFEKAFEGVEKGVWQTFLKPEECWEAVEKLRGT